MEVKKIYFDLDDVLADFSKGVKDVCGIDLKTVKKTKSIDDQMWESIKKFDHFYDSLDYVSGALDMFNKVYKKYGDKCEILTGVPKAWRGILTAPKDKERWVHRMLSNEVVVNTVYREDKPHFCAGEDYILIDDKKSNIEEWKLAGGTGILFKSAEDVLRQLNELVILE